MNKLKYVDDEHLLTDMHELDQHTKLKKTIFTYNKNQVKQRLQTLSKIEKKLKEQHYKTTKKIALMNATSIVKHSKPLLYAC